MNIVKQVVLLPTNEFTIPIGNVFINKPLWDKGNLHVEKCERITQHGHSWSGSGIKTDIHHLYIVSDDEIKEGDWFLYLSSDTPIIYKCNKTDSAFERQRDECKKIIASTDTTLTNGQLCGTCDNGTMVDSTKRFGTRDCGCITTLPQPFIEHYVSEYNKGNIITEVMVEFEDLWTQDYAPTPNSPLPPMLNLGTKDLQINQDNTINIDVVKDESENDILDFGRYILQLTNNVIKKDTRMKPLDEESGEELLKDLYNQWKNNK